MRSLHFINNQALPPSFLKHCLLILLGFSVSSVTCKPTATLDLAAADLDVKITVIDTDNNPSDHKVPVVVQFFSNGSFVKLAGNATITCNGVNLPNNGLGYAERIPIVAAGGHYTFVHKRNVTTTSANVTVPSRPVINSPLPNTTVTRSANLTINYVPGAGAGVTASAADASTGLGGNTQPDNGNYTGLNVSTLVAGPGSIGLVRDFSSNLSGTGFHTVEVKYNSGSDL